MSATVTARPACEQCGKDCYRTYGAAMSAAQHCNRKRDAILRVYYSERCCAYHISSTFRIEEGAA
jgi:hypothetical protein